MGVKTLPWYYIDALMHPSDQVTLTGEEWHHACHVMRMQVGQKLILFDGAGMCREAVLTKSHKAEGHFQLLRDVSEEFAINNPFKLTVAFAPTKNLDRTEFAIEKLVELGIDSIAFLDCEHGERTHLRMDRFKKITISAAKQSHKIYVPVMSERIRPVEIIHQSKIQNPQSKIHCCHLETASEPLHKNYLPGEDVIILIGPEGGFSTKEIEEMRTLGALLTTLGPHRLRVETAAITACAQIHLLNDLKS